MRDVSLAAGLGEATVRELETNPKSNPTLETMRLLARVLNVDVGWLASGDVARAPVDLLPQKKADR